MLSSHRATGGGRLQVSDTTAAEAITLYKGGNCDLSRSTSWAKDEGMAWANNYLQFTKAKQPYCGAARIRRTLNYLKP